MPKLQATNNLAKPVPGPKLLDSISTRVLDPEMAKTEFGGGVLKMSLGEMQKRNDTPLVQAGTQKVSVKGNPL